MLLNTKVTKAGLDLTELGRTGLSRMGGLIYEEFLRELSGTLKVKVYKEMAYNDSVIAAILFAIDMLARQVSWRVQAASEDRIDQDASAFVESCMQDMSMTWEDVISEVFTMLIYGYAPLELVYKNRLGENRDSTKNSRFNDGRIGWRKMPIRAQDTLYQWKFDAEGGIEAFLQQPPPDYRLYEIPIEKLLLFRTKSHKGNPEGESILRGCYCSWYKKKHIELIECIGIERDLAGLPIAYAPPEIFSSGATAEQKSIYNALKDIVTNIRRDEQEGILFPMVYDENNNLMYKFELLSAGGKRNFDTSAVIQRHNQNIAMTVLADFIFLGHGKAGSWSLVSSRTEMFSMALGAWLKGIVAVFNRYAIPRLFALNNIRVDKLPELVPGDIETPDLAELGDFISKLSGAGINFGGDVELENYLRKAANLPEKVQETTVKEEGQVEKKYDQEEFIDAVRELRESVKKAIEMEKELC